MYRNFQGVLETLIENQSCFTKSFMKNRIIDLIFCGYFIFVYANRMGI